MTTRTRPCRCPYGFPWTVVNLRPQLLAYPEEIEDLPAPLPGEDRIMALVMVQTDDEEGKLVNSVSA